MPPSTPIETIWEIWASPGSTPPSTHLGNLGVTREHPAPATPAEAPSTSRIEHRPPISNRCHRAPISNRRHPAQPTPPSRSATDATEHNRLEIWASPGSTQHQRRATCTAHRRHRPPTPPTPIETIREIWASPGSTQHQRRQRKHPAPAELSTDHRSATDATEHTDRNHL